MKFVSLTICIFSVSLIFCQNGKLPGNLLEYKIRFNVSKKAEKLGLPFSSIKVLDFRQDTSKIGFVNKHSENTYFRRLVLEDGFQNNLERFYNDYYHDCFVDNDYQLLVVVTKFWLNPYIRRGHLRKQDYNQIEKGSSIRVRYEYFLKREKNILPIKRIDTVFTLSENPESDYAKFEKDGYAFYEFALINMIEKINYEFYSAKFALSKNMKTMQEVLDFYHRKIQFPVLTDSSLKRGVYLTFKEFRNNNPSIENFTIETNKKATKFLYNLSDSPPSQIIKYWGYCDGVNIYLVGEENPIQRIGNTFQFYLTLSEKHKIDVFNPGNSTNPSYSTPTFYYTNWLAPYEFDMETGDFY